MTRRSDNLASYHKNRGKYPFETWTVYERTPSRNLPDPVGLITVGDFCRYPFESDNVIIWLFDTKSDHEKFNKKCKAMIIPKRQLT